MKIAIAVLVFVLGALAGQTATQAWIKRDLRANLTLQFAKMAAFGYALALSEESTRERNAWDDARTYDDPSFEADI